MRFWLGILKLSLPFLPFPIHAKRNCIVECWSCTMCFFCSAILPSTSLCTWTNSIGFASTCLVQNMRPIELVRIPFRWVQKKRPRKVWITTAIQSICLFICSPSFPAATILVAVRHIRFVHNTLTQFLYKRIPFIIPFIQANIFHIVCSIGMMLQLAVCWVPHFCYLFRLFPFFFFRSLRSFDDVKHTHTHTQ